MGSSSGTSSGSCLLQNSGSEEDLRQLMDQRKRKRMISNRESARRSRMRKQQHLDDLNALVSQLSNENSQIITKMNVTTQQFVNIEKENSVSRAQLAELSHRLQSLNEIIDFLSFSNGGFGIDQPCNATELADGFLNNAWNYLGVYQPSMASADLLQY